MPTSPTSMSALLSVLPDLAAEARARSLEFEERRKLAPDFVDKLKRAGVFRILVPADAGGLAGSLPQWLEVIIALAEADASTGWVSAHGSICAGLIYASAEPRFRDEFFADPDAYPAWSNLPRVKVQELDDGIRINGSWSFESGCTFATFVGGWSCCPRSPRGVPLDCSRHWPP
jgi:alkylation response protein AidB-like acyl-CoA dehydrogenase